MPESIELPFRVLSADLRGLRNPVLHMGTYGHHLPYMIERSKMQTNQMTKNGGNVGFQYHYYGKLFSTAMPIAELLVLSIAFFTQSLGHFIFG